MASSLPKSSQSAAAAIAPMETTAESSVVEINRVSSSPFNEYIAGAVGGVSGIVVGHPLDTTKVYMQTQKSGPSRGVWRSMFEVYQHGWSGGLLRGMGFPIVSYGLVNSVFFGVYGNTLKYLSPTATDRNTKIEMAVAGGVAGFAQVVVACPVDVVKVVLQSQLKPLGIHDAAHYIRGPVDCLRQLYATGGLFRCYRAFNIMILRDIPASVAYFVIFESTHDMLLRDRGTNKVDLGHTRRRVGEVGVSLLAGGVAGVLSWSLVFPIDVVKSRLQADFQRRRYTAGWRQCVSEILHESRGISAKVTGRGNWRAFYTGLTPCLMRAFPVNAVTFAVNCEMLKLLQGHTYS